MGIFLENWTEQNLPGVASTEKICSKRQELLKICRAQSGQA